MKKEDQEGCLYYFYLKPSIPQKESSQYDHHEELLQDSQRYQIFALDDNMGGNNKSKEAEF